MSYIRRNADGDEVSERIEVALVPVLIVLQKRTAYFETELAYSKCL